MLLLVMVMVLALLVVLMIVLALLVVLVLLPLLVLSLLLSLPLRHRRVCFQDPRHRCRIGYARRHRSSYPHPRYRCHHRFSYRYRHSATLFTMPPATFVEDRLMLNWVAASCLMAAKYIVVMSKLCYARVLASLPTHRRVSGRLNTETS